MARIRKVEIANFRGIKNLTWQPSTGINCLIGAGDAGKSTVLDAIDLCLGARRSIQFTDADFHLLDVDSPIVITLTIGDLDETLKNIENYGLFLRGFDSADGSVEDEPEKNLESVLTLTLTVGNDLEPSLILVSDRAKAQNVTRNLTWSDRVRLAPTRIGAIADSNLGWRRGSVLNRLTDERADASAALAKAARDARNAFGDDAEKQLEKTLSIVEDTASELGIKVGSEVRALLDAHSVTFGGGTISLHNKDGVPLAGLGVGSTRLLVAGLQRKAASQSSLLLVDEVEHGLEPHRINRFLDSLGCKEETAPLQVFMTTHSPVVLRELAGSQLYVLRNLGEHHSSIPVGTNNDVQSTIRLYPDAFLATAVLVCEGASEVGFIRGIDQFRTKKGRPSIAARGVSLIDCGGGDVDRPFERAIAFQRLGYRVAILRDDDLQPTAEVEKSFRDDGGNVFSWGHGRTLEDSLFQDLSMSTVGDMLNYAEDLHGADLLDAHIKSVSNNAMTLKAVDAELGADNLKEETRKLLGRAARTRKAGWFKSISWMEYVARHLVTRELNSAQPTLKNAVRDTFKWALDG